MVSLPALSRAQFRQACEAFIRKQNSLHTADDLTARGKRGWQWVQHSAVPELGYMARVGYALKQSPTSDLSHLRDDLFVEELDQNDDSVLPQRAQSEILTVQQYIVYSPSFQVPAFYFTIHDKSGSPLPLKEILQTSLFHSHALPEPNSASTHGISTPDSNFPLLSLGDHPVLGTPCWYFHPCETTAAVTELLEVARSEAECILDNLLLRWMEAWFLVLCSVVDLR